jgi:hypothetical protein
MIYLAAPYTHPLEAVRTRRFHQVNEYAAQLTTAGLMPFSPITLGHTIYPYMPEGGRDNHGFWMERCIKALMDCSELMILLLDDWSGSRGVKHEFQAAVLLGVPVTIQPQDSKLPTQQYAVETLLRWLQELTHEYSYRPEQTSKRLFGCHYELETKQWPTVSSTLDSILMQEQMLKDKHKHITEMMEDFS